MIEDHTDIYDELMGAEDEVDTYFKMPDDGGAQKFLIVCETEDSDHEWVH